METVTSADGTTIAFERTGEGPALVLLHGTGRDHTSFAPIVPELSKYMTTLAVDRRGRGESGDADSYALEREVEDVLAVINAVEGPVHLLGHSWGAIISLEAAMQTDRLHSLVLYEPPFSVGKDRVPDDLGERLERILATGDREAVLVTFLLEGPRYTLAQIEAQRARPDWAYRRAFAHTLPRETQAVQDYTFDRNRVGQLGLPTLLMLGSESPALFQQSIEALHMTLPKSEVTVLQAKHHNAIQAAPELFAEEVMGFLGAQIGRQHESPGNPAPDR
jgi:pimeloyl-ACP methyl ester carboxylesterase